MAQIIKTAKAKLFCGILTEDSLLAEIIIDTLKHKFGDIDCITEKMNFDHTGYYDEIGGSLFKILISFNKLIKKEKIADIKHWTNKIEKKYSVKMNLPVDNQTGIRTNRGRETEILRRVNIDPGYMTLSNVFLASCKDYYHRVYIGKSIFLENELRYCNKKYIFWDWTYPDYKKEEYLEFFVKVRKIYHKQLQS